MSANATSGLEDRVRIVLRTADQYYLWKARINASCWAATRIDVFSVTDTFCRKKMEDYVAEEKVDRADPIGKCWTLITQSLHDDLFLKLVHVEHGLIATLMLEIRAALLVNIAEDIQPLRLELYGASMQRDCNNDLQTFIAYIIQRRDKLLFLKVEVPEEELVHILLKGLPSIFQPLQVHFSIPGNKPGAFTSVVELIRKFSASPIVSAELAKLKANGISQNVFTSVSRANYNNKPYCIKFSKTGSCSYGDRCKFFHANANLGHGTSPSPQKGNSAHAPQDGQRSHMAHECSFCHYKGHTADICRKKAAAKKSVSPPISLSLLSEEKDISDLSQALDVPLATPLAATDDYTPTNTPFIFVLTDGLKKRSSGWVFDSGATCCATYDVNDCVDVEECQVTVTAAGCVFEVSLRGTAVILATDKSGLTQEIRVQDCLISDKFPFKLLALQTFAKKGHVIKMEKSTMTLINKNCNLELIAHLDPYSKLYFLLQPNPEKGVNLTAYSDRVMLMARSYAAAGGDLLWKLHLRHGHKNFADVCRQYGMPVPKTTPACASCVMGKAHIHPHLSSGFTRATRPAEGFHSDFRGPFSCPTPFGHNYLLTIIDDYSRRIFAFLVKSQSEWYDIWLKFVTRMEAEMGRANCISWLLSDNGAVYKSTAMTALCSAKGIQQRHSAPYSQFMDHTAERNMRTIGEMMTTTLLHANLPKKAWGWAALHAADVINRTSESAHSNKGAHTSATFSRLERWKGAALPGQAKGLYPFGCLAFKHVPSVLRTKLEAHATPMVYLGIDASSRAFTLGSLYDLATSVSVEVTFFENVFPFRKIKQEAPSALLWGADPLLNSVDPRLGAFDTAGADLSNVAKLLERNAVMTTPEAPHIDNVDTPVAATMPTMEPALPPVPASVATIPATVELRRSTRVTVPRVQTNQRYREPIKQSTLLIAANGSNKPQSLSVVLENTCLQMNCSKTADAVSLQSSQKHTQPAVKLLDESGESPSNIGQHQSPTRMDEWFVILNTITEATLDTITPRTAYDALKCSQKEMWLLAMNREKECHAKNGTFGHDAIPAGAKSIPADWVYKIKHRGGPIQVSQLSEKQFKARVVIRGQYMREGLNYNDTFAPVAKPTTLRALLAIATKYKCFLKSGDVETAFLTARMDCEVWVRLPPYWGHEEEQISDHNPPLSPRLLLKGVPGIPQGSRLFYETFAEHLLSLGYKPSHADKCLFINQDTNERKAILIWVDDFVIMYQKEVTYIELMAQLRTKFNVPSTGPLVSFLGMHILRETNKRRLTITQSSSINVLLERANMLECNPATTPCVAGTTFSKKDSPAVADTNTTTSLYRSLVAMANFIACWTRPDITYVVNKLCKFMANPGDTHWKILKHLLRYLAGTRDVGICFDFDKEGVGLHGYTDSSFADCPDSGRSTLAYIFLYDNAVLSWYSKLNGYVTTSTNHSEYTALALGAKEAEWLVSLFAQLDEENKHTPVPLLVDNSGVVSMVYNPVDHASNKHVKIGCHYTRELASSKIIIPQRVTSEENLADVLTKPLGVTPFRKLTSRIISPEGKPKEVSSSTTNERMLMMTHSSNSDSEDENDDELPDPTGTSSSIFRQQWPFISVVKAALHAATYTIMKTDERFSSGRAKYSITFYGSNIASGTRYIISVHDGMQLLSKKGNPYMVCKLTPQDCPPQPPDIQRTPAEAQPDLQRDPGAAPATISVQPSQPILTCSKCGMQNTIHLALIKCTFCSGGNFKWSCACATALRAPESKTPIKVEAQADDAGASAPIRSRRNKNLQRQWVQQIKYEPPLSRTTIFHHINCKVLGNYRQASIDFANAYSMKRAECCKDLYV